MANIIEYILSVNDQATPKLNNFRNEVVKASEEVDKSFSGALSKAGGSLTMVGGTLVGASAGLIAFGKGAIEMAGKFEQAERSFQVLLGSVEKGTKLFNELKTFAKETPFELVNLQEYTKRLLAMGGSQETVIKELKMLGDVASAVGMEKMPQLVLAFGQIRAKTKLTGEELRQLNETGVPIVQALVRELNKAGGSWQTVGGGASKTKVDIDATNKSLAVAKQKLKEASDSGKAKTSTMMSLKNSVEKYEQKLSKANATGSKATKVWVKHKVTAEEIVSNTKDMGISFKTVNKALASMTASGGIYDGMMKEMSKTAIGMSSNVADAFGIFQAEVGTALLPTFKKVLQVLIDVFQKTGEWAMENQKLIQFIGILTITLGTLGIAITSIGAVMLAVSVIAGSTVGLMALQFVGVALVIGAVVTAFMLWKNEIMSFLSKIPPLAYAIAGLVVGTVALFNIAHLITIGFGALATVITGSLIPSLITVGGIVIGFVTTFALPIVIIGALATAFYLAYTNVDGFKTSVDNAIISTNNNMGAFFNMVIHTYNLKQATDDLIQSTKTLKETRDALKDSELRVEQATINVERATGNVKAMVEKYGASSIEAREAEVNRKIAVENLKDSQNDLTTATNNNTTALNDNKELQEKVDDGIKKSETVLSGIIGKWDSFTSSIRNAIDSLKEFFRIKGNDNPDDGGGRAYANGGWVNYTGQAKVHQGEFVLSKDMLSGRQSIPQSVQRNITNNVNVNASVGSNVDAYSLGNILGSQLAFNQY